MRLSSLLLSFLLLLGGSALSQAQNKPNAVGAAAQSQELNAFSASMQQLVQRIGASVVQINCSSFTIATDESGSSTGLIARERSTGSGILLSSDGYIMTNAHVVQNARKITVQLNGLRGANIPRGQLEAKLIGADTREDLALIKIEATGLPFATLADSSELQQGQLVLAFGSPLGLENSVSMGVVSSTARQISPNDPRVFIQTDAAINPGNSGGPLVDASGRVVGINTFILTQSGGSEGIGFAIPASVVRNIFTQLRATGHVHRGQIGVYVRSLTPALAEALNLTEQDGVVIEDVIPDGPAEHAGMKVGDVVLSMGGHSVPDIHHFAISLYRFQIGETATVEVMRGKQPVTLHVQVTDAPADPQRFADMVSQDNVVPRLGILGLTLDEKLVSMLPELRISSGVVVAARSAISPFMGDSPQPGDIIHAVNTQKIENLQQLRTALDGVKPGAPLVLQVERSGTLNFLVLETD